MDGDRFWRRTGVVDALVWRGADPVVVDRLASPRTWFEEADHLAAALAGRLPGPAVVIAGSNGCSAALRLAIDRPDLVEAVALCWPVTVDPADDAGPLVAHIADQRGPEVAAALLAGETVRGVTDDELRGLTTPAAVLAPNPENAVHRRSTADRLRSLLTDRSPASGAAELTAMPEPPMPGFLADRFAETVVAWLDLLDRHGVGDGPAR